MDEPLLYSATKEENKDEVVSKIKDILNEDKDSGLHLLKEVFFAPDTADNIKEELASIIGKTKNIQLFNMTLSHFILQTYKNQLFLIKALKEFANPKAVRALIDAYKELDWECREEIIKALANIPSSETFEFLTQVFNNTIELEGEKDLKKIEKLRQLASEVLSKHIV